MKLRFNSCRKAIHDRRSIHGEANSFKPSLEGKGDHAVVDESMKLRFNSCRRQFMTAGQFMAKPIHSCLSSQERCPKSGEVNEA